MEVEQEVKQKSLSKTEQNLLDALQIGNHPTIIKNVMLQPKAVALYDYIKGYEFMIRQRKTTNIKQFDMARGLFRKLWPNSYISLLD